MDEELPPNRSGEEKAFVGSMMNLTAVDFDEMIKVAAESSTLTPDLLRLEQLPQIVKYYGLRIAHEKYSLVGPDGTLIPSKTNTGLLAYTPLIDNPVGWAFPKVEFVGLEEALSEFLRCSEGLTEVSLNPWEVKYENAKIKPFSFGETYANFSRNSSIPLRFVNPEVEILTPFFRRRVKLRDFCCSAVAVFDPESSDRVSAVSGEVFGFKISEGIVKFDRGIVAVKGSSLPDAYKLSWYLKNPSVRVRCKPKYDAPLLRIVPDTVFPLKYEFKEGVLSLVLLNLDNLPHTTTVIGSFRVKSAKLVNLDGVEEDITSEFDRVKFVAGRWKIVRIDLEVSPLIEKYLAKKAKA